MIIEIAVGILLGYLLIKSFPYVLFLLVKMWEYKWRIFFPLLTAYSYFVFFLTDKEEFALKMSAGGVGLISMFISAYLLESHEDEGEQKSIKGFFKALRNS